MKQVEKLYEKHFGHRAASIDALTPAGSNRRYFRFNDGDISIVGVEGTSVAENEAFIYLANLFCDAQLPVPQVIAVSDDRLCYLLTDLGDRSLFANLNDEEMLVKTMRVLPKFHYLAGRRIDFSRCFPVESFDAQAVMWDLNYFKYSFLNTCGIAYDEPALEADFRAMAERLGRAPKHTFMYRDFQSRNVMIHNDSPYFIDFQGGRRGPAEYDLASFLWQAKAGFSAEVKDLLLGEYLDAAREFAVIDEADFRKKVREMALLRTLQVLGAYGFRGRFERKAHFLQSIPFALNNLRELLAEPLTDYPCLNELLPRMIASQTPPEVDDDFKGLTVRVGSFSYKKGLPADPTPNGGGFYFDCRAMDNPGRYAEYKKLTGLDEPVITFLEERGEITRFLSNCYSLVDAAVENYLSRGFTSLLVQFGCTGGQHRSVYSAQHMAEHIKRNYPQVRVLLNHREQNISAQL